MYRPIYASRSAEFFTSTLKSMAVKIWRSRYPQNYTILFNIKIGSEGHTSFSAILQTTKTFCRHILNL